MRILQICNYQYPNIGGIERVASDYSRIFSSLGIENRILCFNSDASDGDLCCRAGETVREMTKDGAALLRCGVRFSVFSQGISFDYPGELRKLLESFRPDIVIFHYPNPYQAHYLLRYLKPEVKLWVLWHMDIIKQKMLRQLFAGQDRRLIRRADVIIGPTIRHITAFRYASDPVYRSKGFVVPIMVDPEALGLSEAEERSAAELRKKYSGRTMVLFVGRHVEYKGLHYLIEASKLLGELPVSILIAGEGPLTRALMREAGGDEKIEFLGRVSEREKRILMHACDLFCFPSVTRNEAFGIALAECMAVGKPAVTFTIPGSGVNLVNVDGVTGIECPNRSTAALAEAIRRLAEDPALRKTLGEGARTHIEASFVEAKTRSALTGLLSACEEGSRE